MPHHQLFAEAVMRDRMREATAARARHAVHVHRRQRHRIGRLVRRTARPRPA